MIRRLLLTWFLPGIGLVFLLGACEAMPSSASASSARVATLAPISNLGDAAQLSVDQINVERAQRGLLLLRSDPSLVQIANARSADMIARNYFSHYDPQTGAQALLPILRAVNLAYHYAGENIAEIKNDASWVPGWLTVQARYSASDLANEFVRGWLNSPDHRANMLSIHYRRTGMALAVTADGRRIVATQVFAD